MEIQPLRRRLSGKVGSVSTVCFCRRRWVVVEVRGLRHRRAQPGGKVSNGGCANVCHVIDAVYDICEQVLQRVSKCFGAAAKRDDIDWSGILRRNEHSDCSRYRRAFWVSPGAKVSTSPSGTAPV